MERFDILDRDGRPTGETAAKGAALSAGQYYLGVHIYIHNAENEFLLQRRALDKAFRPGEWDIHMGHVVAGETPREAALREMAEEIGMDCPAEALRHVDRVVWEDEHHLIDVFALETPFDVEALTPRDGEVIGLKAVSREEMTRQVGEMEYRRPSYRRCVLSFLEKL